MMRIDPEEILAGFKRWPDVEAFAVGPSLYCNKRTGRIEAATSFAMAYLLEFPKLIVGARAFDVRFWSIQKYGGMYYEHHSNGFILGFPLESCFGLMDEAIEAYKDGLATRELLRANGVKFLEYDTAMTICARYTPPAKGFLDDEEVQD